MTDDGPRQPPITPRNVWEAIDSLRNETREARHSQANLMQRSIAEVAQTTNRAVSELESKMDSRLRVIENMMAQANPVSLGPRINDLERWQSRVDGDSGLPSRLTGIDRDIDDIQSWRSEFRGSMNLLKAVALVLSVISSATAILAWLALNKPPAA